MDKLGSRAVLIHAPHRWRGIGIDRSSRDWPVLTFGFVTLELVPIGQIRRLRERVAQLLGRPKTPNGDQR